MDARARKVFGRRELAGEENLQVAGKSQLRFRSSRSRSGRAARERAREDCSRDMVHALVPFQTVRVAPSARGTRRAVAARRSATVPVRASARADDVASVSSHTKRTLGGLASVASVAAAPAAPAHGAAVELAQVRVSRAPGHASAHQRAPPSLIRNLPLILF